MRLHLAPDLVRAVHCVLVALRVGGDVVIMRCGELVVVVFVFLGVAVLVGLQTEQAV